MAMAEPTKVATPNASMEGVEGQKLNTKQRRKLQRQAAREAAAKEVGKAPAEPKDAKPTTAADGEGEGDKKMNAKQRRKLQRQAAQASKESGDLLEKQEKPEAAADETLNTKQRRLLKRKAARAAEGVDEEQLKKQKIAEGEKKTWKRNRRPKKKSRIKTGEDGDGEARAKSIHLTLFVGQLPFKATEEMVRKHFHEAGEIQVRMLTDKKTKRFKGTAFIEVKDSKALGAALSRHHTLLAGRRINVEMTASGGGNKSEQRREKLDQLRKKQSSVQLEKTKALLQKHIDSPEYKMQKDDVDERMIDFLSWFDYETAKKALDEYNRCVSERVANRKAFFMGILKRFRQTDGVE